jgi:hypothetical protein
MNETLSNHRSVRVLMPPARHKVYIDRISAIVTSMENAGPEEI